MSWFVREYVGMSMCNPGNYFISVVKKRDVKFNNRNDVLKLLLRPYVTKKIKKSKIQDFLDKRI